jgi:glucokinase
MAFAIGVDLGGTNLRIAAIDEQGRLIEKVTTGTQLKLGRDAVISEMAAAIQALSAKFISSSKLIGVGIGVPGITDKRTGMLRESPNLPGWENYPVRDEIEKRLQTTVMIENDANAAAFGEAWLGAAQGVDSMCIITLGTGVGGGIVQDGRVWHGMSGMAGEVGHVTIDPNGPKCNCGNYGCAEVFASATAIVRMAREAIAKGTAPGLARIAGSPDVEFSAKTIQNLALQGDKAAQAIFDKVGWALGILLADLVNILNLDMYVIGGGVSAAWESFAPALFDELAKRSMVYAATAPEQTHGAQAGTSAELRGAGKRTIVTRALLGSDAGLYGAARLPMVAAELQAHAL